MLRDLWTARGRVAVMIVAVAVALTGIGAMLVARTVVLREAAAAYAATAPAAATLDVDGGVDAALLARVRQLPGVLDATTRRTVVTRARVGGEWRRMLLFVVAPDDPLRIARFRVEPGRWPAPDGELLVERAALPVLATAPGGTVQIGGAGGALRPVHVAGVTYDAALAPAEQERTGYGYLTPATAAQLGYDTTLDQLKIVVADPSRVDAVASDVAARLGAEGHPVHSISAPPNRHPHQNQTNTITGLFLGFALAGLLLAGVLVATTLGGMLAAQTRQIGVLKAVGATTGQLLRMYLVVTLGLAAASTVLAVAPAVLAGQGLVGLVAGLLNIDLTSREVPVWVFAALAAAGLGVPVLIALVPLGRAARISVRAALDDAGVDGRTGTRRTDRWLARLTTRLARRDRVTMLALRNLLRRRTRLALTLALLACGGALFTTGLNTAAAWQSWVDQGLARRTYTSEIQLASPAPAEAVRSVAATVPGVSDAEPVLTLPATPVGGGGAVEVQRTYPDGGHGRFVLTALAPDTAGVHFEVRSGRWLADGDSGVAVLNQNAVTRLGHPALGSEVTISAQGRPVRLRVVGTVAEVGGPAAVYAAAGDPALGQDAGLATGVRIRSAGDLQAGSDRVEAALAVAGLRPSGSGLTRELRNAVDEHVVIFTDTLVALAVLMAVVGVLGLGSAMTISVVERTREYGVLQTLGATPATVRRMVLIEGVLTGLAGSLLALLGSIPLSIVVGNVVGQLTFALPLPFTPSAAGAVLWIVIALASAATATASSAARAGRLTVAESLVRV
jgi:putative ABC transport system permease protein